MESLTRVLGAEGRLERLALGRARLDVAAGWSQLKAWATRPRGVLRVEPGPTPILRLAGRLDHRLGATLKAEARALSAPGPRRLKLDVSALDGWNTAGLAALVATVEQVEEIGGEIELHAPTAAFRRVLEQGQLHRLFTVTDAPARAA